MKTRKIMLFFLAVTALCTTSCSKISVEEEINSEKDANSTLIVRAVSRAGTENSEQESSTDEAEEVSYPVMVYVFDDGGSCVNVSTISSSTDNLSLKLPEGSYTVYAIGGAEATVYNLPAQNIVKTNSEITLLDGKSFNDLMTSSGSVTLKDGETNELSLVMNRKVMMINSVVIKNLPDDVTAAGITISPLHTGIQVNGEYTGSDASHNINLTEKDGNWTYTGSLYLLETSSSSTVITVSITRSGATKSYSYTLNEKLEANHKVNITGTFDGDKVLLSGTITGVKWGETKTITFNFGDKTAKNNTSANAPEQGTIYKGCYVYKVEQSGVNTNVTLIAPDVEKLGKYDTVNTMESAVNNKINDYSINGIAEWRLPTLDEIKEIYSKLDSINAVLTKNDLTTYVKTSGYLFINKEEINKYMLKDGDIIVSSSDVINSTANYLRLFKTITF